MYHCRRESLFPSDKSPENRKTGKFEDKFGGGGEGGSEGRENVEDKSNENAQISIGKTDIECRIE